MSLTKGFLFNSSNKILSNQKIIMPFRILIPGKVKLWLSLKRQFPVEQFRNTLASELRDQGILVDEISEGKINFKVPFVIWWKWGTSILFFISGGEAKIIQENNEVNIKYRLDFKRLFFYCLLPLAILFIAAPLSEAIFGFIMLSLFLTIVIPLIIYEFRRFIKRCATNFY